MDTVNPENTTEAVAAESAEVTNQSVDVAAEPDKDWKTEYERLQKEARKHEARAKDNFENAKKWLEYEKSQKPEADRIAEELAALKAENENYKLNILKTEVAGAKNIPAKLIPYLTATTREDLEQQADDLISIFNESVKPKTTPNPEQGKPNGKTTSDSLASWVEENLLK